VSVRCAIGRGEWGGGDYLRKFINIFIEIDFFLKLVTETYSTGLYSFKENH